MKHFFDNVRDNNQTCLTENEEHELLSGDITYLRKQCTNIDNNQEISSNGFFAMEKSRLYKIMHGE
jgi:hypothetical protein